MIELLVVVLVLGTLAGFALPSFLTQRSKARDACAKSVLRETQSAAIVYSTQNNGTYTGMTLAQLNTIEQTIPTRAAPTAADPKGCRGATSFALLRDSAANAGCANAVNATNFCIRIVSASLVRYNIVSAANGAITRNCYVPAGTPRGGCPTSNRW